MSKKIKFTLSEKKYKYIAPTPVSAIKMLPEWFKNTPSTWNGNTPNMPILTPYDDPHYKTKQINLTIKKCVPLRDSMSMGYIIPTISDIQVKNIEETGEKFLNWVLEDANLVTAHHEQQMPILPIADEFHKFAYKWINPYFIQTPKGYSSLFITPLHHDLPFYCLPGVVDTDTYPGVVHFPFLMKKNFQGIIEKGTPMIQVIPFKRDEWLSEIDNSGEGFDPVEAMSLLRSKIIASYKNQFWNKKTFN
jgi:hypothetical protein